MTGRLWLWKNFVNGEPQYWAFDNPYPCHPNGDPITLGEPCGYAVVKPSARGRDDVADEKVIEAIKRATSDRWIPVTERRPDDDLTVMIAPLESDEDVWLGFHDADGWHFVDAMPAHVSHWKPMPDGPKP